MDIAQNENNILIRNKPLVFLKLKITSTKLLSLQRKFRFLNKSHSRKGKRTKKKTKMKKAGTTQKRLFKELLCARLRNRKWIPPAHRNPLSLPGCRQPIRPWRERAGARANLNCPRNLCTPAGIQFFVPEPFWIYYEFKN